MFAGMEFSSGSGDLLSLPARMLLDVAAQLTQGRNQSTKMTGPRPLHHEQALLTQQLANPATVGTSAIADVAFQRRT